MRCRRFAEISLAGAANLAYPKNKMKNKLSPNKSGLRQFAGGYYLDRNDQWWILTWSGWHRCEWTTNRALRQWITAQAVQTAFAALFHVANAGGRHHQSRRWDNLTSYVPC